MPHLDTLIRNYTIKYDRKIQKICCPLVDCLGIPYFTYYSVDQEGHFTLLSNYVEQNDFYFSEKLYLNNPYLVAPDLMRAGSVFVECTPDLSYLDIIEQQFEMRNVFVIVEKKKNGMEGFLFALPQQKSCNSLIFLNHFEVLKKFGHYFLKEAESIIGKIKAENYNLIQAKGESFFTRSPELPLSSHQDEQMKRFLKAISPLSQREHQCLDFFRQGKSAQATAEILGLSRRTVEFYFENIKDKLGCFSKRDLLDS